MKQPGVQLSSAEHLVAQDSVDILSTNAVAALLCGGLGVHAFDTSGNYSHDDMSGYSKINHLMVIAELGGAYETAGFESVLAYQSTARRIQVPKTITRSWRDTLKAGSLQRETTVEEEVVEHSGEWVLETMTDPRTGSDVPKARLSYNYNFYNNRFNSSDDRVLGKKSPFYGMNSPKGMLELQGSLPQDLADNLHDLTLEKPVALRAVVSRVGATIISRIAGDGIAADSYRNAKLPVYSDLPDHGDSSEFPGWSLFVGQSRVILQPDGEYKQTSISKPEQGSIVPVGSVGPEDMRPALR